MTDQPRAQRSRWTATGMPVPTRPVPVTASVGAIPAAPAAELETRRPRRLVLLPLVALIATLVGAIAVMLVGHRQGEPAVPGDQYAMSTASLRELFARFGEPQSRFPGARPGSECLVWGNAQFDASGHEPAGADVWAWCAAGPKGTPGQYPPSTQPVVPR